MLTASSKDEPDDIQRLLRHHIQDVHTDAVLLSGGTGLSPRDGTYEVVRDCLEKELTGFGELFRYLSYDEIGAAAMMSRATAGVAGGNGHPLHAGIERRRAPGDGKAGFCPNWRTWPTSRELEAASIRPSPTQTGDPSGSARPATGRDALPGSGAGLPSSSANAACRARSSHAP